MAILEKDWVDQFGINNTVFNKFIFYFVEMHGLNLILPNFSYSMCWSCKFRQNHAIQATVGHIQSWLLYSAGTSSTSSSDCSYWLTVVTLQGFIDAHETPLIGTRSSKTKDRYSKRPLCVLFVPVNWSHEYREMTAAWRDKLLPIANK